MKRLRGVLLTALVLMLTTAMNAHADHGGGWHGHHGGGGHGFSGSIWIGPGWGPGWWGPPYPYYVAPPVVIQQQSQTYIQQPPPRQDDEFWYYCADKDAYYPYVKECPKGWLKVVPTPAPDGDNGK